MQSISVYYDITKIADFRRRKTKGEGPPPT